MIILGKIIDNNIKIGKMLARKSSSSTKKSTVKNKEKKVNAITSDGLAKLSQNLYPTLNIYFPNMIYLSFNPYLQVL